VIVLDEQLLGYDLPEKIGPWYRGPVKMILELRPDTLIPDDEIPRLLRAAPRPTFVTINVKDFWRRAAPDRQFAIICFSLLDRQIGEIPRLLRRLFALKPFQTRRSRLGKIVRVTPQMVQFYTAESWAVETIEWP